MSNSDPVNANNNIPAPLGAEAFSVEELNNALDAYVSELNKFHPDVAIYPPAYAPQDAKTLNDYVWDYLFPHGGVTAIAGIFPDGIAGPHPTGPLRTAAIHLKSIIDAPTTPREIGEEVLSDYVYFYIDGAYEYDRTYPHNASNETNVNYDDDDSDDESYEEPDENEDPTGPPLAGGRRNRRRMTRRKQKRVTRRRHRKTAAQKRKNRQSRRRRHRNQKKRSTQRKQK